MPEEPIEYHFVITAQKPLPGGGHAMGTWSAYLTPRPGQRRHEVFAEIRDAFEQRYPDLSRACVTFFSLEPNTL
ncbi:hypothetical protein [Streptomyces sp. NPDC048332]|uniref:hypothetical protein n=1 Tax=Streptomyces sp. NPDC048332 TaxID=3154619 RepID=UPI003420F6F1